MAFYKKRIVRRDTQADIDWRIANNTAREIARHEMKKKFPTLTAENFQEACDYQERRIAEIMHKQGKQS